MNDLVAFVAPIVSSNAFFGLVGGAGYAGTRLATAFWGGLEIDERAKKLAMSQFVMSLMLAPFAAHVGAGPLVTMFKGMGHQAASLMIGMLFNAIWPIATERAFLRRLIAESASSLAKKLAAGVP